MGFSKLTTNLNNHQSLNDEPNLSDGMTAEQLKVLYDKAPNDIKTYINNLIDAINDKTSAGNVGAKSVSDGTTSSNVQAELDYLLSQLQGIVLDQIPDGTITEAKMNNTYANSLAKKSNITDIGEIRRFSSEVSKNGYLLCDGAYINKTDYPEMLDKLVDGIGKYYVDLNRSVFFSGQIIKYGNYFICSKPNNDTFYYSTNLTNWTSKTIEAEHYIKDMEVINNTLFAITSKNNGTNSITKIYKFVDVNSPVQKFEHTGRYDDIIHFLWDNNGNIITCAGTYIYSTDNGDTFTYKGTLLGDGCYLDGYFYFTHYSDYGTMAYKIATTNLNSVNNIVSNISAEGYLHTKMISKNNKIYLYNGMNGSHGDNIIYVGTDLTDMTAMTVSVGFVVNKDIANNELFICDYSNNVKIIKNGSNELEKIYTSSGTFTTITGEGVVNEIDREYFEIRTDGKVYMTNFKKLELPSITNSSENGYHYIKVSEVN